MGFHAHIYLSFAHPPFLPPSLLRLLSLQVHPRHEKGRTIRPAHRRAVQHAERRREDRREGFCGGLPGRKTSLRLLPPPLPTVVLVPQARSTSSVFGRRIYLSSQRATLSSLFLGGGGRAPCLPPANSPFSFHTHASLVFVLSYVLSLSSSGRSCLTPPLPSPSLPSLFPLACFAPGGECSCCCGSTGHRGRRQESDLHR